LANGFTEGIIGFSFGLGLDKPFHQAFQVGFLWRAAVQVDVVGEHGIGNPKGLNDLGKDGEMEDLGLYRRN